MKYFKDCFLTDDFFIKGHVPTGGGRLSTLLNRPHRQFVEVEDATCIRAPDCRLQAARVLLRIDEILMAHEACEAGDCGLRVLAGQAAERVEVVVHVSGRAPLEVRGRLRRSLYEREDPGMRPFVVLTEPRIRASDGAADLVRRFPEKLDYVILNLGRASLIHT